VGALRARQRRNFLSTLLLSQGVPMLLGGDEISRTQQGNNNAWCQDNEISWYDWRAADAELLSFTRRLIGLRRRHPIFRRRSFLTGEERQESGLPDVWWFSPEGRRMTKRDWERGDGHTLGVFLNGDEIPDLTDRGGRVRDDSFVLLFNAGPEDVTFTLPTAAFGNAWELELATADPAAAPGSVRYEARDEVSVTSRSLVLVKRAG
jgi:isoamylase